MQIAPQTPGQKLSANGIREFVVGTGGAGFHPFTHPYACHCQKRIADKLGVLELTLSAGSYQWAFWQINQSGKKVTYSKGDSSTTRFPCPKYP